MKIRNAIVILLLVIPNVTGIARSEIIETLPAEPVYSLTDSNGDTWYCFGMEGGGVVREVDGVFEQFTRENCGIASNNVNEIIEDVFGNIWFNLALSDDSMGSNFACSIFNGEDWNSYFPWYIIRSWRLDDDGMLWIICVAPWHGMAQIESFFNGVTWHNFPAQIQSDQIQFSRQYEDGEWKFEGLDTDIIAGGYGDHFPLTDNFPLTVGSTWSYKRSIGYYTDEYYETYSDTISVMVAGTIELDGYTWAVMMDGGAYRQDEKGDVYIYGSSFEPFFDFRPCEGENCNPLYLAGPSAGFSFTRSDVIVEVLAGSYNGWRFSIGGMFEWSSTTIVPGIGKVMHSYSTDYTPSEILELVSYNIVDYPVHIQESSMVPAVLEVSNVYPNPFNPTTTIRFIIPQDGHVAIDVYNVSGQKVATLVDDEMDGGTHSVMFDGSDLASGVYFYRLESGGHTATGKMLLMK